MRSTSAESKQQEIGLPTHKQAVDICLQTKEALKIQLSWM